MLKQLWQWLKRSFQRLFGNKQTPPLKEQTKVEPPKQLTDAEYELLFLQLLTEINDGLSRGGAKGFLVAKRINETRLVEWLQGFGEGLLASSIPNDELATRMVRLGKLSIGEVSIVAYDIGRRLGGGTNHKGAEDTREEEKREEAIKALFVVGYKKYESGEFEAALSFFKRTFALLSIDVNDDDVASVGWEFRGIAQDNLGEFEEAIASFDSALKIKPDNHEAWFNRGVALGKSGQHEEAIASFDSSLKIEPDFHQAWIGRGVALEKLERFEESIASFDSALKIKPDDHEARYNRGLTLEKLGQHEEAITSFDSPIKIKPDDHEAWYNRGNTLMDLGRFEEAIASFGKALKIKPDDHLTWYNQGLSLGKIGRFEEAIASFSKALKLKPDDHKAWIGQGVALGKVSLRKLGHHEEAIASFDNALRIKPDDHEAWINRGFATRNGTGERTDFSFIFTLANAAAPNLALKFNNLDLNKRGYEGELASYEEGLKHCQQDTHSEGRGLLHQRIGDAHYFQAQGNSNPRYFWRKAVNSYKKALQTLTAKDFPELHLKILEDLIRVQLDLRETTEAIELQRQGTDLLRHLLLNESNRYDKSKKQLALKFAWIQQLTVDLAVQSGDLLQAIELAEEGKNTCLRWLLDGWSDESSSLSYSEMQQLLNPSTAIIYWHLSPHALHTFILKHNASSPIVLGETEFVTQAQRLQNFEGWVKNWNEQYADYRDKAKDEQSHKNQPWRQLMPEKLQELKNILYISAIQEELNGITNLILIPHRDLHRLPLHAIFTDNFTITYLPSAQIGITLQRLKQTNLRAIGELPLLSVEHPDSEDFSILPHAEIESAAITQLFQNPTPKRISGEAVTNTTLKAALKDSYSIFHFTGHSTYNFDNPKKSALALSAKEFLTLEEICNIESLKGYQLVSLSSCETAITSNQTITAEYVGLVSAFLYQGVTDVVSTLWTVTDDASCFLMIYFYWQIKKGKTPAVALNKATKWLRNLTFSQLERIYRVILAKLPSNETTLRPFIRRKLNQISQMELSEKKQQRFKHPYYWAAFTITGGYN
ncbi:tetratricopeptide repeat protein [Nostoc edaphicum CCNP1411]|uniref:Tetratricopeptide repeat protein n=1 Tax=Nostoc edaphicum CCNP1411 TaxID=1472755 RepID=A0A7D7QM04_9NOSO|nr:tetratricopeptide repeat protein [Nostoc edaphicum]QMS88265.1 tetratricopeptide repeat protein [Nostoc edaphicum CCNP1411]